KNRLFEWEKVRKGSVYERERCEPSALAREVPLQFAHEHLQLSQDLGACILFDPGPHVVERHTSCRDEHRLVPSIRPDDDSSLYFFAVNLGLSVTVDGDTRCV